MAVSRRVGEVASVARALRILSCFDYDHPELGVSEIARQLGLHKSTVYRSLRTLKAEGFVRQTDGSRYAVAWKLLEIGAALGAYGGLRDVILTELGALVEQTRETAHLGILEDHQVLYIEKVESPRPLRMPSAVGRRTWPHFSSIGKVLLASLDDEAVLTILEEQGMPRLTKATITNPQALLRELEAVRLTKYAVSREEIEEGLMSIAAPVYDDAGQVCAAVNVGGPVSRLAPVEDDVVAIVQACAERLSSRLGSSARWLRETGG